MNNSVIQDEIQRLSDGYITSGDVNTCDVCWDMNNQPPDDIIDMYSHTDPGL